MTTLLPKEKQFKYGKPRCLEVIPDKFIIIGTDEDKILIYNYQQSNLKILKKPKQKKKSGPITTLDMNPKLQVILAGYETGWLILWDTNKRKACLTMKKIFEGPVIQIKTLESEYLDAAASDAAGNVYLLSFKKKMFR